MIASDNINLSVIIPVHNSEQYLEACIDSLLASEGISGVEIIIVDDGSSDGSVNIADRYALLNNNIKVTRQSNGGASCARNTGLEQALGRYVFFLDSDDSVKPGLFSQVIKITDTCDSDVILWDGDVEDESGYHISKRVRDYFTHSALDKDEILSGKDALYKQLKATADFPTVIWLGAYRRSFLFDCDLLFKNGIHHEDDLWIPQVMLEAKSVLYIHEKLYLYRMHSDSLSRPSEDKVSEYIESLLEIFPYLYGLSDNKLAGSSCKKKVDAWITRKYLYWIFYYDFVKHGYKDRIDKRILLQRSGRFKDLIRVIILYVLG
ncbi:MAG: glycosyltransferase [Clostridiales bacterium]|nr:glycosyltransferase [Clostridiales bacterium]